MMMKCNYLDEFVVGFVLISDCVSMGVYEDKGILVLQEWFVGVLVLLWCVEMCLIQDDVLMILVMLIEFVDVVGCDFVLMMGGIGFVCCDVMLEVMLVVVMKEMLGFGEQMWQISLNFVLIVILLWQVVVI